MANIVEAEVRKVNNDFIFVELSYLQILSIFLYKPKFILANYYLDYSWKIAIYLITLCQFLGIQTKEFNAFMKKIVKFKVQDNQLFAQIVKTSQYAE